MQEPDRKFNINEIVEQTGLTRKELKMAVRWLCKEWGLIMRESKGHGGKDTTYWINLEKEINIMKMLNRPIEQQ